MMDGTTGPIGRLIDEGDVVYGVWPDAIKPHGIDYGVLKGGELLEKESGRVKHCAFGQSFVAMIFIENH